MRDDIERGVDALWVAALGAESLEGDQGFFELGGDSLAAAEFVVAVSERFACEIDFADFFLDGRRSGVVAQVRASIGGGATAAP